MKSATDPDLTSALPMPADGPSTPPTTPDRTEANPLQALRAEIDRLDDALHGLLMRRAEVVARLASSRAKGNAPTLRPGREAQVMRRLLARHAGPLPRAAILRFWRDIFAASTAQQGPFSAVVQAVRPEHVRVAREHFGALTPLRRVPTPALALAMVAAGEASVAVLPLPEEDEPAEAAWWTRLDSPRLQVAARLPFWTDAAEPGAEALVVSPGSPDPSGEDRSLLRLEGTAECSRTQLQAALAAAGLPARQLLLRRNGSTTIALAELDGVVTAGDPRLAGLPVDHALPLGFYAVPMRGE